MSRRDYAGTCSVHLRNKKDGSRIIGLVADDEGKWSSANAEELLTVMRKLAKQHKAALSVFAPNGLDAANHEAVIKCRLSDGRQVSPYLAILPKSSEGPKGPKNTASTKLA